MEQKPDRMDEIWTEAKLCDTLGLSEGKAGKSRLVSTWIRNGLPYIELSEQRYFVEKDVVDFLWSRRSKMTQS